MPVRYHAKLWAESLRYTPLELEATEAVAEFEGLQAALETTSLGKYKKVKDSQRTSSFKVSTGVPESLPPLLRGTKHQESASSSAGGPSVVRDVIIQDKEPDSNSDSWNYMRQTKPTGKLAVNLEQLKKKEAPSSRGRGGAAQRSGRKDKPGHIFFSRYEFDSTKGYPGEGPSKLIDGGKQSGRRARLRNVHPFVSIY